MVEAKEFILKELAELHEKFPTASIMYEHDMFIETHIIQIIPEDIYNSEDYVNCEILIKNKFYDLFPKETVLFVSEDSINKVNNPILEIVPVSQGLSITIDEVYNSNNYEYSAEFINLLMTNTKSLLKEYQMIFDFNSYSTYVPVKADTTFTLANIKVGIKYDGGLPEYSNKINAKDLITEVDQCDANEMSIAA